MKKKFTQKIFVIIVVLALLSTALLPFFMR